MNNTNQIIHERLMGGECYHDWLDEVIEGDYYFLKCSKCPATRAVYDDDDQPQYDSDLNLCFQAQAKAIERFGWGNFGYYLLGIFYEAKIIGERKFNNANIAKIACANAEQRCAAIVKLLESEK